MKYKFLFYLLLMSWTAIIALIHGIFGINFFTGLTIPLPALMFIYLERKGKFNPIIDDKKEKQIKINTF